MAIPETGALIGTPPSIKARVPEHTVPMEELPLDSRTSPTRRIVYSKSSGTGRTLERARLARFPWPISRRLGPPALLHSPTEKGGKL